MKRNLLSLAIALVIAGSASAQEASRTIGTETKKGANVLPAAGDFAIGVDATPFLRYAGNMFNKDRNRTPRFEGTDGSLFAKYFLTDKTALRATLDFDFTGTKETENYYAYDYDLGQGIYDKEQTRKNNYQYFQLALGYEVRRGYGRLQGFYGGEVVIGGERDNYTYTYNYELGNQFSDYRDTQTVDDRNFNFGLGGFAGVEYFVAPKISLGAQLGIRFITSKYNPTKYVSQGFDGTTVVTESDFSTYRNKGTSIYTDTRSRFNLTFHF